MWASQNIWALKFTYCIHRNLTKVIIRLYNSTPFICKTSRLLSFNNFFWTILQSYLFAKFCISLCSQCSDKQKLCSLRHLLFFPSFSRTIITSILDISTYNSKMEKHAFPIQEFRIKRFILTIQLHVDFLIVQIWIIWQVSEVWNKVQILSFYTFVRRCDGTKVEVLGILRDQLDKYSVTLSSALITEYTYQNCR